MQDNLEGVINSGVYASLDEHAGRKDFALCVCGSTRNGLGGGGCLQGQK